MFVHTFNDTSPTVDEFLPDFLCQISHTHELLQSISNPLPCDLLHYVVVGNKREKVQLLLSYVCMCTHMIKSSQLTHKHLGGCFSLLSPGDVVALPGRRPIVSG